MKSRWQPSRFHGRSSSRPPQPNPPRATRYHPSMTGRRRRVTRRPGRPGRRRSTGSTPPPGMGRRHFRASSLTSSTARNPTARASRPGSSCRRASSSARAWSCPEDIDGAVGRVLREALAQPAAGAPRRPDAIRVADSVIAAAVRAAVQGAIPVTVAPTPELDDLRAQLIESMPPGDEDESYFAGGRVSPAAVERLFTAARALFAMKPWSLVADTRLLRMDIPALNVDGASLVVTGPTSGRRGVFIFPTPEGFDTFSGRGDATEQRHRQRPHRRCRRLPGTRVRAGHGSAAVDAARGDDARLAGRQRGRVSRGGVPRPGPRLAPGRRAGRRDRHRLRPVAGSVRSQARADLLFGHVHAGVRVVLRRRRPRSAFHCSVRCALRLRRDGTGRQGRGRGLRRRARFRTAAGRVVPTAGRTQRPLSVRQRAQVQELLPAGRRGRACQQTAPRRYKTRTNDW